MKYPVSIERLTATLKMTTFSGLVIQRQSGSLLRNLLMVCWKH